MFNSVWRSAQRLFKWVEHAHTWVWIGSFFNWPAALISAAVGVGAGIWTFVTGRYGPYAFVVALTVAVLVLILARLIRPRAQPETTPITPPAEPVFDWFAVTPGDRMPAREFVHFLANKLGMAEPFGGVDDFLIHPGRYVESAFQRVAKEGHIEVIGRKDGVGPHEVIPSTFWYTSTIDQMSVDDATINGKTHPAAAERGGIIAENVPIYTDLWFKRADVYKAY